MKTVFGPAGIPISCKGNNIEGLKHSISLGLGAYEVEFVRGVRMSPKMAKEMQSIRERNKIRVSCHAPYYINCNNIEKFNITRNHLLGCVKVSQDLKFTHIVFHIGYLLGMPRDKALKNSIKTIQRIIKQAYDKGYKDFTFGPETTGRKSQIGTINELISICKEVKECKPVIDWGHVHAFTKGGLKQRKDFLEPLELIRKELGKEYLKGLHCHFSEVEYGDKGEVRHRVIGSKWGPDFRILARLIKEMNYDFTIICETPLIEQDALKMQEILNKTK
jgi:deoxyribonuclease-4